MCLNKGHADIVTYKGVFIYFLRYSATGCTNQEFLRQVGAHCIQQKNLWLRGLAILAMLNINHWHDGSVWCAGDRDNIQTNRTNITANTASHDQKPGKSINDLFFT
jgi:hypothetical protein